ncbi:hypothetical protein PUMCH_001761 [Australozyma saopauloensis]|uniref:non-specific serine/threonine protein kinase n=1 Tax=Australozyma saopauloensis TaxID=291208 RepID=A0AAX4H7N3_9ASCO|nr:hypothetical protein PUMCH_001761 [[Candida] saopauloensis]
MASLAHGKTAFLERFKEGELDELEADPGLSAINKAVVSKLNHNIQFLPESKRLPSEDRPTLDDQPFLNNIRRNIGEVQVDIFQGTHDASWEDTLPFGPAGLDGVNSDAEGDVPVKQKQVIHAKKVRSHNVNSTAASSEALKESANRKISKNNAAKTALSVPVNDDAEHNQRKLSVVVAMTPAQRIEKHRGMGSSNALDSLDIREQIGRGAHGIVYKALNKETGQLLAVKVLRADKEELAGLMGEIDLLKILKHPNIVKYHGFVKTSETLNVLLEYCSGGSLRQLYKRLGHGIPEAQIKSYVKQILEGLNYLHVQGVVHRDVKAANVLLTESGEVKLADFGVATTVAALHNTCVGTPHWMAPETVMGGDGSCTVSDIWSLGATIIELFTMNPPYHDLVPMAAIHAIVNNEHPILPHALSAYGQDFLLECFQKTPALRKSAALLLLHHWLSGHRKVLSENSDLNSQSQIELRSTRPRWAGLKTLLDEDGGKIEPKYTRAELLLKFREGTDEHLSFGSIDFPDPASIQSEIPNRQAPLVLADETQNWNELRDDLVEDEQEDDHDRFSKLDIVDYNSQEVEKEEEMIQLLALLVEQISELYSQGDTLIKPLTLTTSRIYHLAKKYPICVNALQKDHSMISFMELLDFASDFPQEERLWYNCLGSLNCLFSRYLSQVESFSTLGGIPKIIRFSKHTFSVKLRLQVAKFTKFAGKSDLVLKTFVASGGLQILLRFFHESFSSNLEFHVVSIRTVHDILSRDLGCAKSDLCRTLLKFGIMSSCVRLLEALLKPTTAIFSDISSHRKNLTIAMNLDIINCFGLAGAKVQRLVSNPESFKILINVYECLSFPQQIILLKYFRSMSSVPEIVRQLTSAHILKFYVSLLSKHRVGSPNYKEVLNVICPSIYQCCYLNHERQTRFVKLGAVPYLRDLCQVDLQIRQFILPVFFEFAYCDASVRHYLLKYNVPSTYFSLLEDPYWSYNAMDSLLHWGTQDKSFRWLDTKQALQTVTNVFLLNEILNLEAFLEIYFKVMNHHAQLVKYMTKQKIIRSILSKLVSLSRSAAVRVTLLKILHKLMEFNEDAKLLEQKILQEISAAMHPIADSNDSSLLASDLAKRIMILSRTCR